MNTIARLDDYRQAGAAEAGRPLPANVEAEQAVLGAILLNNETFAVIGARLDVAHFSEELHRQIFTVISAFIREGKPATPVTVKTFLSAADLEEGLSVGAYLANLLSNAVAPVGAPGYATLLGELHARRMVIAAANEAIEAAYDPPVGQPIIEVIDATLEAVRAVADALPSQDGSETLSDTMDRLIANARDSLDGKSSPVPSSGLADFDKTLGGGLRPTRLIVIAGRPGMGKTILLTAIARRAAQKGAGVGVFSLEIDRDEFTARLAANAIAGGPDPIDYRDILIGSSLNMGQIERLDAARNWLHGLPIEFSDRGGLSMQQIETRAAQWKKSFVKRGRRLDVIMIDYLGLVKVSDRYKGNLVNEYGEVALAAKNMAKRLDTCVVLLSQLSRGVESRDHKRPMLSDLRGSGNIEEHADAVGLLYRPGYYDKHDPKVLAGDPEAVARADGRKNLLELIWEKNRLGPTVTDQFFCDVGRSQVDTYSRHQFGGN